MKVSQCVVADLTVAHVCVRRQRNSALESGKYKQRAASKETEPAIVLPASDGRPTAVPCACTVLHLFVSVLRRSVVGVSATLTALY